MIVLLMIMNNQAKRLTIMLGKEMGLAKRLTIMLGKEMVSAINKDD
jgi:hypothetical protein